MKLLLSLISAIAISMAVTYAQVPQTLIILDLLKTRQDHAIRNKTISIKSAILDDALNGTVLYEEGCVEIGSMSIRMIR